MDQQCTYRELIAEFTAIAQAIENAASLAEAEPLLQRARELHQQCQAQIAYLRDVAARVRD
jgi:exonuclease VII small subunit